MGADDWDYSYYRNGQTPTPRRQRDVAKQPEAKPLLDFSGRRVTRTAPLVPASEAKVAIKRLLAFEPDLTVDEIFQRLRFAVTVSKTTVSGIRTEFRHSMRVLRDVGWPK